jgi:ethanolamine utilization protein EutQ (cupin superfamily)
MILQTESQDYTLIHDADAPRRLVWWHKLGLALLAIGFVPAAFMCHISTSVAPSKATELLQNVPRAEVMTSFQGNSNEYGGYGFESGGRFSASLQTHQAGSKNTSFLLDHRFQYVVDGEIHITDGTGQTMVGQAGDLFYLPYGSKVTHHTPHDAVTYVSIADAAPPIYPEQVATLEPEAYRDWVQESGRTSQITYIRQIKDKHDRVFGDDHIFFNGLGCWKWNVAQLPANHWTRRNKQSPNWNFCCGVFHLTAGPPAFTSYAYNNHEELDFIIGGEFEAKDANGRMFTVKEGDLVHNPRHMNLEYTTPTSGTFFSTSLSPVDDFFPTKSNTD